LEGGGGGDGMVGVEWEDGWGRGHAFGAVRV
jgi:hypothetical protein